MRPRNRPIYVNGVTGRPSSSHNNDPFFDVQLDKILKELSFIRIQLDEIVMTPPNPQLEKLSRSNQLFGCLLEYSFPCLDAVSKSLKSTYRIPQKYMTTSKIEFKHKRVVLLTMHEDQVPHWQRSRLTLHLLVQMSLNGKHTTRPLGKCFIPLHELLVAPYMICRDFDFIGEEFEGTALIRIDLGTRVKSLMERLEALRGDRSLEDTFVVTDRHREAAGRRTRSRSSSRCRAHSSASCHRQIENEQENEEPRNIRRPHSTNSSMPSTSTPTPVMMTAPRMNELAPPTTSRRQRVSSSVGSDSVFLRPEATRKPTVTEVDQEPFPPPVITRTVPNSLGASTVGNIVEEVSRPGGKYYIQLTVHDAVGLPPVLDENNRITSPSSFISVVGREGNLCSPVVPSSREPRWEFTARFAISSERRNLIVKVVHRGPTADIGLGFVMIPLPAADQRKAVFEMSDVAQMNKFTNDVPMLTISLERIRNIDDFEEENDGVRSRMGSSRSRHYSPPRRYIPPRTSSPLIMESSEAIKGRMHKCMAELETMMRGINK